MDGDLFGWLAKKGAVAQDWLRKRLGRKPKLTPYGEPVEDEESDTWVGEGVNGLRKWFSNAVHILMLPKNSVRLRWVKPAVRNFGLVLMLFDVLLIYYAYPSPLCIFLGVHIVYLFEYLRKSRL